MPVRIIRQSAAITCSISKHEKKGINRYIKLALGLQGCLDIQHCGWVWY